MIRFLLLNVASGGKIRLCYSRGSSNSPENTTAYRCAILSNLPSSITELLIYKYTVAVRMIEDWQERVRNDRQTQMVCLV